MDLALQSAFLAKGSTLLILLAGAVLLYRSFREKYLVPWIAGWIAYSACKLLSMSQLDQGSVVFTLLTWTCFLLAVGLFSSAILLYTDERRLILPTSIVLGVALVLIVLHDVWFPNIQSLDTAFAITWRLGALIASTQLLRLAWGRPNIGRWLLAFMLPILHVHLVHRPGTELWHDFLVDLALGISMMTIVLDDSRVQIQRLDVLNTITHQISESQDFEATVDLVLTHLMKITRAPSAWFRLAEGDKLVMVSQRGLSGAFQEQDFTLDANNSISGIALRDSTVYVVRSVDSNPAHLSQALRKEGIHHSLVVPVEGKNSRLGVLVLAISSFRAHRGDERAFLKAAAKQLGLAVENHRLADRVEQSRSEWAGTFDSIPDSILVHDSDYRILRANQALLSRLEMPFVDITGQLCESIMPGAGLNWANCPYCAHADCSGEEDPCFGGYSVVSTSPYTNEEMTRAGTVHVIKDITEAKASEERYTSLFNHMHEGVFASTPNGKLVDCNEAFVRMLGYSNKEEVMGLDVLQSLYVDNEDRKKFLSEITRQGFVRNFEYRLRRKDGKEVYVIESSFATRDPGGRVERYQGVVMDVTEMKHAEDEIRRRNRELYVLNNIAVTFNQSFDLDEILQLIMLQIVELLGTDTASVYLFDDQTNALLKKAAYGHRSAVIADNDMIVLPGDFVDALRGNHTEIVDHQSQGKLPEIVTDIIAREGLHAWMWVVLWRKEKILGVLATSSRAVRDFNRSEEGVLIAVGRQLATTIEKIQLYHETRRAYEDLRRTQEQLLQSEKMSAVGQLISGVAHELNNPLTAILGYAQLLESEKLEARVQEFIQKLYKQAQRTQKIVQNLLSFARQHKPQRVHVDLRSVMEDTIALRDYDLKVNNITVQRDFEAMLPSVIVDPHQLEQVYLNIINNAADAMLDGRNGGVLRIKIFSDHGQVVCEFHDSGPGLNDPKHVFDPFYTTKSVGKGTGLGLSICYGIVKEHGGEIAARNHPSGGALIQVRLPVAVGEKPLSERERIVARRESRLEGQVLLVDDEEAVLDFEREVLTAAGLTILTANSGAQAIEYLSHEVIDAVFLDSKIPGDWSSEDVYRYMEKHSPDLVRKTILVLSNVSDPAVRTFVDATQIFCLVKPFEVADLLAVARRVLRRAQMAAHGG